MKVAIATVTKWSRGQETRLVEVRNLDRRERAVLVRLPDAANVEEEHMEAAITEAIEQLRARRRR